MGKRHGFTRGKLLQNWVRRPLMQCRFCKCCLGGLRGETSENRKGENVWENAMVLREGNFYKIGSACRLGLLQNWGPKGGKPVKA